MLLRLALLAGLRETNPMLMYANVGQLILCNGPTLAYISIGLARPYPANSANLSNISSLSTQKMKFTHCPGLILVWDEPTAIRGWLSRLESR